MEYVRLGETGTEVSRIALGTWRFGKQTEGTVETTRAEALALLDAAADLGVNFIDTANDYGPEGTCERWIGDWLDDRDREEYVVASKVYWTVDSPTSETLSRKTVRAELQGTLDRLGTDYVDIYYLHRWDDGTPVRETLRTLDRLVDEGKINHVGMSTTAAWKLTKGLWTSDVENLERFTVTQPQFNAVQRDQAADYLDVCDDQNLAVCPYSPLAGGFLTGKYERQDGEVVTPDGSRGDLADYFTDWYVSEEGWEVLDAVRAVAEEESATPAQVALRWLMDRERFTCVPIVGARTPDQLRENAAAADLSLSEDQRGRIDAATE
jgi:aryl-alcohol dehydrogenase-like predicted oxidoreductase